MEEISLERPLLDSLVACHCISTKHKEAIENKALVNTDKIRQLLEILRRRSFSQFQLFLSCLESTDQQHVRDVLQSPGGKSFDLLSVIKMKQWLMNTIYTRIIVEIVQIGRAHV